MLSYHAKKKKKSANHNSGNSREKEAKECNYTQKRNVLRVFGGATEIRLETKRDCVCSISPHPPEKVGPLSKDPGSSSFVNSVFFIRIVL